MTRGKWRGEIGRGETVVHSHFLAAVQLKTIAIYDFKKEPLKKG
jgi:hypothetical protein